MPLGVARGFGKGAGWLRSFLSGLFVSACLLATEPLFAAADPVFDAKGFQPNREMFSQLPFEHIDPMTGNLLLTFTDLVLPGNAGFDLRIQRTYNSKICDDYTNVGGCTALGEDSWAGLGWTLHLGRVLDPIGTNPGPIIEMSDGSRHQLYLHMDGDVNHYISKDYWTYDKLPGPQASPVLRLPNGLTYTFGHSGAGRLYVTEIKDPFGNKVAVTYANPPAPEDVIANVEQQLVGGQTRTVTFTFNETLPNQSGQQQAAGSLDTMTFLNRTWTYTQKLTNAFTYTLLMDVQPPVGPTWMFGYNETNPDTPFVLVHVDTPNGGDLDYTYTPQVFYIGSSVVFSPAVTQRQTSGRDVPSGTWSYLYSSSTDKNETEIISPCGTKTTHSFLGIGPNANQDAWAIGALDRRTTADGVGAVFETDDLTWIASVPISNVPESGSSPQTHVALLGQRDVTRSGRTYSTSYAYSNLPYNAGRPNNFNDFGRAHTISETGDLARTTSRTFFYGSPTDPSFGTYIVDKIESETVQVGSESFTRSYTYDAANSFKTSETIYGITTNFTPHSSGSGNVRRSTDANNHSTTFDYDWGVPDWIQTPEYTITRTINEDGTVASEKRRGFTTSFLYDPLSRPTRTTPHLGNPIVTTYDNAAGTYVKVTRGASELTTSLDGFGRLSETNNKVGIKTDVDYDACGRRIFESYPFVGNTPTGTTYTYDPLGRVERLTHANGDFIEYDYPLGVDVDITDEEGRLTRQHWNAFGDPTGDTRLVLVTDAKNQTTQHTFNALGKLTSVTFPGGGTARTWAYNTRNELITETHPENGTTIYTYDPAGNLETRTDARFGTTTFSYDRNNRLIGIDRPGSSYDSSIGYDESDNRTSLVTADVSSGFSYDPANRLTSRADDLDGVVLQTGYAYDANDNLERLTYPSGAKLEYEYDMENRIKRVDNGGPVAYADLFKYHPSGAVSEYFAGNNLLHKFGYDQRYRLKTLDAGGSSRLRLTYTYDRVSNVKSIQDSRAQFSYSNLQYDTLDRIRQVTGAFGAASFDYDEKGNRLFKQIGTARTDYTYDPVSQLLLTATGAEPDSFSYDLNGNLIANDAGSYTYTPTNTLASYSPAGGGSSTSYIYDGDDLRKVKISATGISYYVHGPGGQLLGEYKNNAGALRVVREYVLAGTRLIAEVTPSVLTVNPQSLTFLAVLDRPPPSPQSVALSSSGGSIPWTRTLSVPWLRATPASGTTPATLSVWVDASGLAPGSYAGAVTIIAPDAVNSPVVVTVQLTVFETASLYLSPSSLSFYQPAGDPDPPSKTVSILYPGEPVPWQATRVEPWIWVSPGSGFTPGTLTVLVSGQGLPPGTHRGSVIVTSQGIPGSPQTLTVELVIGAAPGQGCAPDASYCEIFDDEPPGPLAAGWIWSEPNVPQVVPDPRDAAAGQVMLLDPPAGKRLNGDVNLASPHAISGTEISVQIMTTGTNPAIPLSLAKIEFYTQPGRAWAKTTRTFGTLRFGSTLRFQYGPTNYQMLVNPMQAGRWYAVKVRYEGGQAQVYVDGDLKFTTAAPDADLQLEAFSLTAWDFAPGAAYVDVLESRPGELVVDPMSMEFEGTPGSGCLEVAPHGPAQGRASPESHVPHVAPDDPPRASSVQLPVTFEQNVGQADSSVKFVARAAGHMLLVRSNDIILALPETTRARPDEQAGLQGERAQGRDHAPGHPSRMALVRMKLGLPDRAFDLHTEDPHGLSHYFIGDDLRSWRRNVRRYRRVVAKGIYPGIDLALRDNGGRVEYDLLVAPGADVSAIEMEFEGASDLRIDAHGDLVLKSALGHSFSQPRPRIYQVAEGIERDLPGGFRLGSDGKVGFVVEGHDPRLPLVIDPVVAWSTSLGGTDNDGIEAMALDGAGNIYVTGSTISADFPLQGPFQPVKDYFQDAFVSKLLPDGSGLVYSSYLGGSGIFDVGWAIQVDSQGRAVVAGDAGGTFPIVNAAPIGPQGLGDVFLAQVSEDGGSLVYSTRIGGSRQDFLRDAALDAQGRIHLVGFTESPNFPLQNPFQAARAGTTDAFVLSALNTINPSLVYSSYLGGTQPGSFSTFAYGVAVDGAGDAYLGGWTTAGDFPQSTGCTPGGLQYDDIIVAKVSAQGALQGIRCLGGSFTDITRKVALGQTGEVYVVGVTTSPDFPVVNPLFGYAGGDAFILALTSDLAQLSFSTPFGGTGGDHAEDLAVDSLGRVVVTGLSGSGDLPVVSPIQACPSFPMDNLAESFLLKLEPGGADVVYSTYLPGSAGGHWARTLAIAADDSIIVAGRTWAAPMMFADAFITKVVDGETPQTPGSIALLTWYGDSAGEGTDPSVTFFIQRLVGGLGTVGVDYATTDQTATAGSDYGAVSGTATLPENQCQVQQTVSIFDDLLAEPDETFLVSLSNPTGGAALDPKNSAVFTIFDDDGGCVPDPPLEGTFTISHRSQPVGPTWQASDDASWLSLDPTSGKGPSTVMVFADPTGLTDGTYTGRITVTATDATGSPQEILVTLVLTSQVR